MGTIERLNELGQSVWLDFLDHDLLASGELRRMIEHDGLRGMTSNPTIFQKAIAGSDAYEGIIREAPGSEPDSAVLEHVMVADIREACDQLRSVYDVTEGSDGFVSLEVSPEAARDTARSIEDAHRLWREVGRPNLMVKIPGTREGLPAIRRCLADGLNINITLLFSVPRYVEVADAWLSALEERAAKGAPIDRIASVASFFVSRVDTRVDRALDATPNALAGTAEALRGEIGIANAKIAYEHFEGLVATDRFRALAAKGARPQRLLWASTSPKDPRYPDVYYADALIGAQTVDTMPRETMRAFLDHGRPELRLAADRRHAHGQITALAQLGIDFDAITAKLEEEGVATFAESFHKAIAAIAEKRRRLSAA